MNRWLRRSAFRTAVAAVMLSAGSFLALAHDHGDDKRLTCNNNGWEGDRQVTHCEIREVTVPASGAISVDARKNGGVSIKGWDRNELLVRSRVQTRSPTQVEAETLAKQITIQTAGGKIFAQGPESRNNYNWSVSYEIFVPRRSDVSLETYNGGLSISDVSGNLTFNAMNGGVVLRRVGGSVKGSTTNGGLVVELTGDRWDGEALDVRTTNGGIVISIPENYSAHLETGTVNGNLSIDFPVTVQGRITRELAVNLGSGGALVRATTTNGGVRIKRVGGGDN
jgi:DUF4097 and DUF4098 domain-containing protein YvlB